MRRSMIHKHHWVKAPNQTDTGLKGIRMYCDYKYTTGAICGRVETRIKL